MENQTFADRMRFIKPATSQELIAKVKAMRANGIEVFDFSDQGASPDIAKWAAIKEIHEPSGSAYSDTRGLQELRQAVAKKKLAYLLFFYSHKSTKRQLADVAGAKGNIY